ncbi:hypothetical protein EAH75_03965 [Rhodanobacter glycinis]|uniref:Porin n=1 Tax=Rhodanobacter glycinis TaxID=582702 RepID=A0A502BTZ3_9GAMM|nr:hypothetical protein [Rhodanobacter glycinis]TPG04695.1 hypothetical protein EAH88_17355 [Rhodanobacter glycinis]TPG50608.1 hypothetical protein EAH75_03965 [Rhodanobacter glycinis]
MRCAWLLCLLGLSSSAACAQDFKLHAWLDGRLVAAPDESSWTHGGLGKTRFGNGGVDVRFGGAGLVGAAQFTPALLALAEVQFQNTDYPSMSVVEAYLRYRPVSLSRWRWSVQAGAFIPPISLENEAIGWTSPWTLTPSAINSWVGEELRAVGAEGHVEWRGDADTWELRSALFRHNDPAGNLLAIRGWSLSDLTYGLGSRLREPDAMVRQDGRQPPGRYDPFQNIGNRNGWYADLSWRAPGRGSVSLMRYDNRADPAAHSDSGVFAWHTYFWTLGATADTGPVTWITQAMDGGTVIEPLHGLQFETHFGSAFLLAGWNRGAWRPTLRIEHFSTRAPHSDPGIAQGEHGNAITAALNWRPREWLRLTAEVLRIDSVRTQRVDAGLPAASAITQIQLGIRLIY